jgi:hypothetical protein
MTTEKIIIIKQIKTELKNVVKKFRASKKSVSTSHLNAVLEDLRDGALITNGITLNEFESVNLTDK